MREALERLEHISKHYDSSVSAEHSFDPAPNTMYGRIRNRQFSVTFSFISAVSFTSKSLTALDIGCSSGRYTEALLEKDMDVVGLDTAIIPLTYAVRNVPKASFLRASVTALPFEKESFDIVICVELLHHFTDDILEKALEQITRLVKPGGIFIFDLKNKHNPVMRYLYQRDDRLDFTLKTRTIARMTGLMQKHGFEVIRKVGIMFPLPALAPFVVLCARKQARMGASK